MLGFLQELGVYHGDELTPQQFSNPDEQTPKPLAQGEFRATEGFAPEFRDDNLADECAQDHRTEDAVAEDVPKVGPLSMDLAGVDLVEKLHQHEGVEDDGVVWLGRGLRGAFLPLLMSKNFSLAKTRQKVTMSWPRMFFVIVCEIRGLFCP